MVTPRRFVFSKGGDQMRCEWVLLDIPQCQEIIPVSNWLALESLLKEMSYSSILVIVVIYIG